MPPRLPAVRLRTRLPSFLLLVSPPPPAYLERLGLVADLLIHNRAVIAGASAELGLHGCVFERGWGNGERHEREVVPDCTERREAAKGCQAEVPDCVAPKISTVTLSQGLVAGRQTPSGSLAFHLLSVHTWARAEGDRQRD